MSSTSLSPAPSGSSRWRVPIPCARPATLSVPTDTKSGSTRSNKRGRGPTSEACISQPLKRVREATPIGDIRDVSTSGEPPAGGQNASALAYNTTIAGPSSYLAQEDDSRSYMTSDDEEQSQLFSDQAPGEGLGRRKKKRSHRRSGDELGGAREDGSGDFLPDEDMNEHQGLKFQGTGQDDEEGEERDGYHEESQDHNDFNGRDDGAESPAWLTEPQTLPRIAPGGSPRPPSHDRMSRFLEPTSRSIPSRQVQPPKHLLHEPADCSDLQSPSLPSSYHSGDSDGFLMAHRPMLERSEVKLDIKCFVEGLGPVSNLDTGRYRYKVVDRLGEGMHDLLLVCELKQACRNVFLRLPRPRYPA